MCTYLVQWLHLNLLTLGQEWIRCIHWLCNQLVEKLAALVWTQGASLAAHQRRLGVSMSRNSCGEETAGVEGEKVGEVIDGLAVIVWGVLGHSKGERDTLKHLPSRGELVKFKHQGEMKRN